MEPRDVIRDLEAGGAVLQPWSVLVQHDTVVAVHDPDGHLALQRAAYRLAERSGEAVVIYQVDARLLPPPAPGTCVDPLALGWVEVHRLPTSGSGVPPEPAATAPHTEAAMNEMTYQVEMGPDTHNQLEKPGLTYHSRDEAVQAIRRVLSSHGRRFTIDEDGESITFVGDAGGTLATIRPVRAEGAPAT